MNCISSLINVVFVTFLMLIGVSCNSIEKNDDEPKDTVTQAPAEFKNGTIVYSVEFPFFKDEKLKKFLPKKYSLSVCEDKMYGEMNSFANLICNRFYSDNSSKVLYQSFDNAGKKFQSTINQEAMEKLLKNFPDMKVKGEPKDTTILGFNCTKVFAEFQIDSVPAVALYYTKEINIENPNWINKYEEVDGFLLGYDIEQFGMRMRLMATELIPGDFTSEVKNIYGKGSDKDYKVLEPSDLQQEFKKLVDNFSM